MSESLKEIRSYLAALPQGRIEDTGKIESLLAACWDELSGSEEGGMLGYKLCSRTENMEWNPPLLTFEIERHGATVHGSVSAELQSWVVDVNLASAQLSPNSSKRIVGKRQPSINVNPIAEDIVKLVVTGTDDARLRWYDTAKVKVLISKILPKGSAVKQTLVGRRKRLGNAIAARLEQEGWQKVGLHTFENKRHPSRPLVSFH